MTRRFLALLTLAAALAGCGREPAVERHAFFALGTVVEISVYEPPAGVDTLLRDVETALLAEEQRWRAWENGELAAVNRRLAAGESVELDPAFETGIRRAAELSRLSGGRFNPAIGRLVERWGFHREDRAASPPPADASLAALLPPPLPSALVRDGDGRWRSEDSRLWLDMGAFAKGLAVETAAGMLTARGLRNGIVNAGGDLKALGRRGERAWRIGIRHPRGAGMLASLEAGDGESVFTSGDYERFFTWRDERFHHLLDPATGRPARDVISVTVIHADAALADAAATALFVAGEDWPSVAKAMDVEHVMVVRDGLHVQMTAAMRERITFEQQPAGIEVLAP